MKASSKSCTRPAPESRRPAGAKRAYEPPVLVELGPFQKLTQGGFFGEGDEFFGTDEPLHDPFS